MGHLSLLSSDRFLVSFFLSFFFFFPPSHTLFHLFPPFSVKFSWSFITDSLQPHESQHTRAPCSLSSLKLMSIDSVMPSSLPSSVVPFSSWPHFLRTSGSFSMSQHFTWVGKVWSFSFSISPSYEHPVLISFRMDRLDFLAVQGTLKNLIHHCSSKASILQHSAFFTVQLSHSYMITRETRSLSRQTLLAM